MQSNYQYTQELKRVDLSNLVYYYGLYDENVGALTEEEVQFLKSKKARVVGVEAGHYNIWKRVIDAFQMGI